MVLVGFWCNCIDMTIPNTKKKILIIGLDKHNILCYNNSCKGVDVYD
jgi:hypothetical protein